MNIEIKQDDNLEVSGMEISRPIKGGSIAFVCNTNFESLIGGTNNTETTRNDSTKKRRKDCREVFSWEFLEETIIPGKIQINEIIVCKNQVKKIATITGLS